MLRTQNYQLLSSFERRFGGSILWIATILFVTWCYAADANTLHEKQLTNALQHVVQEQPRERALPIDSGQLDPKRENEKGGRHQKERRREL